MAFRHVVITAVALCTLAAFAPSASARPPGIPELPCQNGIAGADCAIGYGPCSAHAGYRTGSDSYEYAYAYCGPPTSSPCVIAYVDTNGNVYSCAIVPP